MATKGKLKVVAQKKTPQSKSFGKAMNAKTAMVKGGNMGKKATQVVKKNIRKGKGPARKGTTKKGY